MYEAFKNNPWKVLTFILLVLTILTTIYILFKVNSPQKNCFIEQTIESVYKQLNNDITWDDNMGINLLLKNNTSSINNTYG